MSSADGRVYRGATPDQRRAERRARLVEAGLELFGTQGIAATRVDEVCAQAGLTKRYFYESFEGMEALVDAVMTKVLDDIAAEVVPAITEHGWVNPRPAIEAYLRPLLADPRLTRLMVVETSRGELAERREAMFDLAVDMWLQADPHADPRPEHLPVQRLLAHAMAGATGDVALAWVNGRLEMSADEVIDHVVRIFERITPRRDVRTGDA
jgi:AcrR family transcriptional regulator